MAHTWSHLYKIPTTGLRFLQFMVHGEDQIWHFSNSLKIYFKEKIFLHNYGNHIRDFTYIDDIVLGIYKAMNKLPKGKNPSIIYNLKQQRGSIEILSFTNRTYSGIKQKLLIYLYKKVILNQQKQIFHL